MSDEINHDTIPSPTLEIKPEVMTIPNAGLELQQPESVARVETVDVKKPKVKLVETNIQWECKLCQEHFWDRKKARNHITEKHRIEGKLLNAGRNPQNTKLVGRMALIRRLSDWVEAK